MHSLIEPYKSRVTRLFFPFFFIPPLLFPTKLEVFLIKFLSPLNIRDTLKKSPAKKDFFSRIYLTR